MGRQNVAAAPQGARPLNVIKPFRRKAFEVLDVGRDGQDDAPPAPY
jgi:hypothetical protein